MNSRFAQSRKFGWRLLPAMLVLASLPSLVQAECWDCCGCKCMWCAWSQTWHKPTALYNPLRPYYVPRPPAICGCDGFKAAACYEGTAGCQNCAGCGSAPGYYGGEYDMVDGGPAMMDGQPRPSSCWGAPPCGSERLGQIPNDLAAAGGGVSVMPVSVPAAAR